MIFNRQAGYKRFLIGSLLLLTGTAHADVHGEREALARLVHELSALEYLISEAEAHANPDARIRFQYDWLRHDLARMRLGIQEHINAPSSVSRKAKPLRGDYRR